MRVILAEDSALLREDLTPLLAEEGHEVVAATADAESLLAAVAADPPDVAVADVRMPPTHTDEGMRAALEIRRRHPGVGVLALSQYVEKRYAAELLSSDTPRIGCLLKDSGPFGSLTPREQEVLSRMAQGHTSTSIAEQLHISRGAVEKHINAIFDKLRLSPDGGYKCANCEQYGQNRCRSVDR